MQKPIDLMTMAEGGGTTRSLSDLRGTSLDKSKFALFESAQEQTPSPKPRLSTGKVWRPPQPQAVEEAAPKPQFSTGRVWTPPEPPPLALEPPKPSLSTGKFSTQPLKQQAAPVNLASPISVVATPDFSSSTAIDDAPASPPLSSHPFLKADAANRNSFSPLCTLEPIA